MIKQNEIGRSMIEMLGVLGIIGVLSVGSTLGVTKMFAQQKINKTIEQVSAISSKLSQIGAQSGSYVGLDNEAAIKFGAIPSGAVDSLEDSTLINPFGGSISLAPANLLIGESDQQGYTITYTDVPEDACIAISSHRWSSGSSSSLIGMGSGSNGAQAASLRSRLYQDCAGISTSNYAVACSGGATLDVPMNPRVAATACDCPQGGCVLVWMYF